LTHSPAHRLIALWAWIVLLLNGSVDAFGVHPCPHHDAVAHAPASPVDRGDAHGHGSAHQSSPESQDGHDGSCTCLGSCVLGTAAPLPEPAVLRVAPIAVSRRAPQRDETVVLSGRRPYVLPYATAPPARLA